MHDLAFAFAGFAGFAAGVIVGFAGARVQRPGHSRTGLRTAHTVPLALVAGVGHACAGSLDWSLLAQLLACSLPGIWLGSHLVTRTPERLIRSACLFCWPGQAPN